MTSQVPAVARPFARPRDRSALRARRVPGILFFVAGSTFLIVTMLATSMAPGYDVRGGAISDLGVISETALLFNVMLIAVGGLNLVGGVMFHRTHRRAWLLGISVAASIGAIGAGLFPLDTGALHALSALAAFVFFNLEAIATARSVTGLMRPISVAAGIAGLIYVVVMMIGDGGNAAIFGAIGHGGAERLIVYPVMIWMLAVGGYLMAED